MSKRIAGIIGIVAVLLAATVWAQTPQQIAQCRTANLNAHNQVIQMFNSARSRGNITPAEAQAFTNMERTLAAMTQSLNQGGLTLAECQRLTSQIASERATVQRMAATPAVDPRVAQCRTANQRAHSEVVQLFQRARSAGRITPAEAQAFSAMERRLNTISQNLNRGGLTLA
jgi:hypothetical protein